MPVLRLVLLALPAPPWAAHAKCPRCGALERHRALWLFLERETDLFERPGALLHIAPEYSLLRRLSQTSEPRLRDRRSRIPAGQSQAGRH